MNLRRYYCTPIVALLLLCAIICAGGFGNHCLIHCLSVGSAGTSPMSGSQILGDSAGGFTNAGSRSWKRSEDGNVYVQCVTAVYTLARDPFPRVACLGRQVLRIMGVESAQILTPVRNKAGSHQRNSSVPALPPSPSIAGVLHRSTSWVASTSGRYILKMLTLIEFSNKFPTYFP